MDKETLKRKKELELLIESLENGKNKNWLSEIGLEYLRGLERAYYIIFPMQAEG